MPSNLPFDQYPAIVREGAMREQCETPMMVSLLYRALKLVGRGEIPYWWRIRIAFADLAHVLNSSTSSAHCYSHRNGVKYLQLTQSAIDCKLPGLTSPWDEVWLGRALGQTCNVHSTVPIEHVHQSHTILICEYIIVKTVLCSSSEDSL